MHFIYLVLAILLLLLTTWRAGIARTGYSQRKALYDLNPGAEIPGWPSLGAYIAQSVVWHILIAVAFALNIVLLKQGW